MKILLVNDYATPFGGAERITFGLCEGLRKEGHDARLFASSAGLTGRSACSDYECFGTTSRWRTLLQTANPSAFFKLRGVLATFKPDVVHVRMFLTQLSPLILPLLKTVPSLYHVVWYRPVCPTGTKLLPDNTVCQTPPGRVCYRGGCIPLRDYVPLMLQLKLWKRWRHVFNMIVANSEAVRQELLHHGISPVEVVWNGVPTQAMRPPLSSPPLAVFAGRLVREKGVDVLLNAFSSVVKHIPEARLIVAGEGPERPALTKLVAQLRLTSRVTMLGHVSPAVLEQHCTKAWVQVIPSRWEEPFGLVAAEAMMRGTAVIASACGGLKEIVRQAETGVLIPQGNTEALTKTLCEVLGDQHLAERMGHAGRCVAMNSFHEKVALGRFLQIYESLCRRTN